MRTPYHPDRDQMDLVTILAALSDPTRLAIVLQLSEMGEEACSSIDHAPKTSLSYHYAKLREAGVTRTRIEGTQRFISLRRDDLEARFPGLLDSVVTNARRDGGLKTRAFPAEIR
ncbi:MULTISPECIES: ArsR/SmtB family transcription factor [Inquilinus]|uniref:DNA-binding transcriptional ArsR family regulator n=1 Tax=Inquilinus ginsengisoli TaxID=363840 RepID=A0ABU1JR35_9PROT|nr:helix-turn-helix domain-containing protein [Inquilinus ginsengisoli]MDR6291080.1 DNA-binding transcriptional ArsR family regulator [Inquilinus ginsengisoli]